LEAAGETERRHDHRVELGLGSQGDRVRTRVPQHGVYAGEELLAARPDGRDAATRHVTGHQGSAEPLARPLNAIDVKRSCSRMNLRGD
jgi:hypothetical protein